VASIYLSRLKPTFQVIFLFTALGCTLVPLPTHSKSIKLIPMRKLTAMLCLTLAVLLGFVLGIAWMSMGHEGLD
jgi:hypothetical protein